MGAHPKDVYSEDWWAGAPSSSCTATSARAAILFHNFSLGRHNSPTDQQNLWAQPLDNTYTQGGGPGSTVNQVTSVNLCGPTANGNCYDKTKSSANMRFRLNPELIISDNLRIMTQIDLLDNLVLGSTPNSYAMQPSSGTTKSNTGYSPVQFNGGYRR